MKIVSFNVNSIRTRLHQLEAVIKEHNPFIIALQETKVHDSEFPVSFIESLGYTANIFGQKGHYGVAVLSKENPVEIIKGFSNDSSDAQRRIISCKFKLSDNKTLTVIDGYFPQGENRHHPVKFPAKQKFYGDIISHLSNHFKNDENLLVVGDMNIAPEDIDIGLGGDNPKRWLREGKCCFLPEEREMISRVFNWGLFDTYRKVYPQKDDIFSWFDYRSKGFESEPKRGLRIDLMLATEPLLQKVTGAGIDYEIRGMERPSDHCPVWTEFNI